MSFVATAVVGGSIISGTLGYLGATQAANAQVGAETQALAAQNAARAKLDPWINTGTQANATLGKLTGAGGTTPDFSSFINSPDYAFALSQGNDALTKYLNATGLGKSGGALTAVAQYNQGLASQQYGNYFNRLMQLSTLGQGAASAGVGGANAAAGTIGNIGASQASGIIGGTNALTGGINSGISNALLYNAMNRPPVANPSSYAPIGGPMNITPYAPVPFAGAGSVSGGLY